MKLNAKISGMVLNGLPCSNLCWSSSLGLSIQMVFRGSPCQGFREREMIAVKHYRERKDQSGVTYYNLPEQTPPKNSGDERGTVGQTESESGGSRIL